MVAISAPKDNNRYPALIGTSSADGATPVLPYVDPTTHRLLVDSSGGANRLARVPVVTTITASTAETTIVAAIAATFIDVYGITITNTSATGTRVTIKDSTGGTTRWEGFVPATDTRGFMLPADSALPQATVNNNWTATCGTSITSLLVSVFYVKN